MPEPLCLGVEIGGTKLQFGLGYGEGRLLALERLEVDPARQAAGIRAQIAAAIDPLCARAGCSRSEIQAVGIGFGGPVDAAQGVVQRSIQIEGWDEFPLACWLGSLLGLHAVALENDADPAGLAEARGGAGSGLSPVLYVTVGSGVGAGLIVDGRIYRGNGAGAAELGHLWVELPGEPPLEVEQVASGWSLARRARLAIARDLSCPPAWLATLAGGDPTRITGAMVAQAALNGDLLASQIVGQARYALARGLAHAITLLGPRRVILGGGVSLMPPQLWLEPVSREVERWVFAPLRGTFDIRTALFGEDVVVQGALALARDALGTCHRGL